MNTEISVTDDAAIWDTAMDFQKRLAETVEYMTAFNVTRVNVEVKGISRKRQ